jgi:hypothetical protein
MNTYDDPGLYGSKKFKRDVSTNTGCLKKRYGNSAGCGAS